MNLADAQIMTAMVTPFDENNQVSYPRLEKLIEHLLATGTQALLACGTTGEAPTLSPAEKLKVIEATIKINAGRVPVVVGTGSNNTAQTIEYTTKIGNLGGVDAALVVVPYYNKPNQAGMIAHFMAVADAAPIPIIIYNIPGRTGVTMEVETIAHLANHPNIIGVKDCTGSINLAHIVEKTPADFLVYTGEDENTLVAKTIGATGVISVASHLYGKEMLQMYQAVENGDLQTSAKIMRTLMPKMEALFSLPSPGPVKAALNHQNILVGGLRLPLLPLDQKQEAELFNILEI